MMMTIQERFVKSVEGKASPKRCIKAYPCLEQALVQFYLVIKGELRLIRLKRRMIYVRVVERVWIILLRLK